MPDQALDQIKILLGRAILLYRNIAIFPRLLQIDSEPTVAQPNEAVKVTVIGDLEAQDVAPAAYADATEPPIHQVNVPLDFYKEVPFRLTDRDLNQILQINDFLPKTVEAAVRALSKSIDNYLLMKAYLRSFGIVGQAGTLPFQNQDFTVMTDLDALFYAQEAESWDRHCLLSTAAHGNATSLQIFAHADKAGTDQTQVRSIIGEKFGVNWHRINNAPIHNTTGTNDWIVDGAHAAKSKNLSVKVGGTTPPAVGDIFQLASHAQTYVVNSVNGNIWTIEPELKIPVADSETATFINSHTVNFAFQRDAIAAASRPLETQYDGGDSFAQTIQDPWTGIFFRLERTRQHKQTRYSLDCLFGAEVVNPRGTARVLS